MNTRIVTLAGRLALCAFLCMSARAMAADPFPVEPFPYPFRSVAAPGDVSAVRFNPAGLAQRQEVEFAFHHKFSENPSGFNAVTMRAKSIGAAISWLNDPVFGKRREYLFSAGKGVTSGVSVGASFRWLKADDSLLQDRTLWTFALSVSPAPAWGAGARWENALHSKVGDSATAGTWVFGVRTAPFTHSAEVSLDWIYPEWASPAESDLRFAVMFNPTAGMNVRGFIDTNERVGIEIEIMVERSKAGAELRMRDFTEYKDGTAYLSVLDHEYPGSRGGPGNRPSER